jgi:hypothetical protein
MNLAKIPSEISLQILQKEKTLACKNVQEKQQHPHKERVATR